MNDNIVSDGVSRITSTGGVGYGAGYSMGYGQGCSGVVDTSNAWRVDNHGAERNAETIEAVTEGERNLEHNIDLNHVAIVEASKSTDTLLINGFNQARTDTLQAKFDILLDSSKNAAAAALTACTNVKDILAAQAACCCELKERISNDGQTTRALVNDLNNSHNAIRLQIANAELIGHALIPIV